MAFRRKIKKAWWPLQVSLWGRAAAAAGVARWREASSASRSGSIWPEAAQLVGTDPEGALPLAGSDAGPRLGRLRCDFRDAWVSARLKWPCPSRWALGELCKGRRGLQAGDTWYQGSPFPAPPPPSQECRHQEPAGAVAGKGAGAEGVVTVSGCSGGSHTSPLHPPHSQNSKSSARMKCTRRKERVPE